MAEMVSIRELAKQLNVDWSTARRLIFREAEALQLQIHRGKGNKVLLSQDDTARLVASYEARLGPVTTESQGAAAPDRCGSFYIVQLVPEALPNRVKLGYADNVNVRLAEHQTAAPTAKLLKAWPCKRSWDPAAMDAITRDGCRLVLNEVYEGDLQGFLDRAEQFFAVMPKPDSQRQLSEHSPLRDSEGDAN